MSEASVRPVQCTSCAQDRAPDARSCPRRRGQRNRLDRASGARTLCRLWTVPAPRVPHINWALDELLRKRGFSAAQRLATHLLLTQADPDTGHAEFSLAMAMKDRGLGSVRRALEKLKAHGLAVR